MSAASVELSQRETPEWFDHAKLGLFVHWNAAAIPAYAPILHLADVFDLPPDADGTSKMWRRLPYAEMYENTLSIPGSPTAEYHEATYGDLPYETFVDRFRDEMIPRWDPNPLADLAVQAGARYLVLTTKTEDGFLLWPSAHRNPNKPGWQSDRDVVGELAAALRARGVRFGTYYCGGVDWSWHGLPMMDDASFAAAMEHGSHYLEYADSHWRELIERYRPDVLWNDYSFPAEADLENLFRFYLERVPSGAINNRFDHRQPHEGTLQPSATYSDFVTPEYSTDASPDHKWEACRGIGTSFGYNRQESEDTYMSTTELIHVFVDIVARGGNLLINVGPSASGEIPWAQAQRLIGLGWWLRINGAAVYGTRPWVVHKGVTGEGIGIRYTRSHDAVYAVVLGSPRGSLVDIDVRLGEGAEVAVEGQRGTLGWSPSRSGTRVQLPEAPDERPAMALRLAPADAVQPA